MFNSFYKKFFGSRTYAKKSISRTNSLFAQIKTNNNVVFSNLIVKLRLFCEIRGTAVFRMNKENIEQTK